MNFASFVTITSIILIIIFIFLTFFFLRKARRIRSSVSLRREETPAAGPEIFNENWQAILSHLGSLNESEWKLAVIEADKLVNDLLIQKGYQGESMAERLSLIDKNEFKSLDLLWEAHKIRNRIAHKLDFKLEQNEAKKAISYYEEAIKELLVTNY